jgi:hypothetical protein
MSKNRIRFYIVAAALLSAPVFAAEKGAEGVLRLAIDRGVPLFNAGQTEACASIYEVAVRAVHDLDSKTLGDEHRAVVEASLKKVESMHSSSDRAWELRRTMDRLLDSMRKPEAFEPIMEAPLPVGFPAPGPLDRVVLKEYPGYRAARVNGGMRAFWTLFNHIKREEIAMTAPVEMGMSEAGDGLALRDMAFLYRMPEMGSTGLDGSDRRVSVIDVPGEKVLSVGIRGALTQQSIRSAKAKIELELGLQSGSLERAGDWRVLGYNSPMVPAINKFHEVQIPVKSR